MSLDPYDAPPVPSTYWRPRESESPSYTEKKRSNGTLALWQTSPLPEDANVTHVTLIAYRGERAVVSWKAGVQRLPEGEVQPGESVDAAINRIALEQAGILDPKSSHLGHFRSRATNESKTLPPDAITYEALYAIEVGDLADFPTDKTCERRIILQRDLNTLLRSSYVEFRREYTDSLDHYLIDRLKANLSEA
jgi:hypothetical protein